MDPVRGAPILLAGGWLLVRLKRIGLPLSSVVSMFRSSLQKSAMPAHSLVESGLGLRPDQNPQTLDFRTYFHINVGAGNPLAVDLSIHTLDSIIQQLVPFYGENCPISVLYGTASEREMHPGEVVQATLATIQHQPDYVPDSRSALVLIG
jgi:precorrin-4/cobalt-precorrin-4 C11-methyltransferase